MNNEIRALQAARRRRMQKKSLSSVTYTESEPYALCFYLFNMFDTKSNSRIINHFESAIGIFMQCIELIGKEKRLSNVLKKEIKKLEAKNLLTPLKESPSERMRFDDADLPYSFVQDKKVEGEMRHYDNVDENLINLHRILHVSEKPVFSSIINATVFKTGSDYSLDQELKLTKKVEKAIFDISKVKFLMEQVKLS